MMSTGGGNKTGSGLTPDQMALAQFTQGQGALAARQAFSGGMGHSPNETSASNNSLFQEAATITGMQNANQAAADANLQSLASLAGQQAGQQAGQSASPTSSVIGDPQTS